MVSRCARSLAVVAMLAALVPGPALADAPSGVPLPAEPGVVILGPAVAGMVIDLDGDGVRELLRIVPRSGAPGLAAVGAVAVEDDGSLREVANLRLRRMASFDEKLEDDRHVDDQGMTDVHIGDPVRLVAWRHEGVEEALVVTYGVPANGSPCCLTVWRVTSDGAWLHLDWVGETDTWASDLRAVDLDADGTDELVVIDGADPEAAALRLSILDWRGDAFTRSTVDLFVAGQATVTPMSAGESDGLPGEEVVFAFDDHVASQTLIVRLSRQGRRVSFEELERRGRVRALVGDLGFGPRLVVGGAAGGLAVLAWPAGGPPVEESRWLRGWGPLGLLGSGTSTRIVVRDEAGLVAVDPGSVLAAGPRISKPVRAAAFQTLAERTPYVGPFPGGLPSGEQAWIFYGQLVRGEQGDPREIGPKERPDGTSGDASPLRERPPAATGSDAVEPMATLPGLQPIGVFGPGGSWTALVPVEAATPPVDRRGGRLAEGAAPAPTRIAPTAMVLTPESADGRLEPALEGAVVSSEAAGELLAAGQRDITLSGVVPAASELVVDSDAGTRLAIEGNRLSGDLLPAQPDGRDSLVTVRMWLVTPSGHGYHASWTVRVLRDAPALLVEASREVLTFEPVVRGRTDPGAQLTFDGFVVPVAADGGFQVRVEPGILPRSVRLVAEDAVGNRRERIIQVVAPLDYRLLPWLPISVLVTLGAAAGLAMGAARPGRKPIGSPAAGLEAGRIVELDWEERWDRPEDRP